MSDLTVLARRLAWLLTRASSLMESYQQSLTQDLNENFEVSDSRYLNLFDCWTMTSFKLLALMGELCNEVYAYLLAAGNTDILEVPVPRVLSEGAEHILYKKASCRLYFEDSSM